MKDISADEYVLVKKPTCSYQMKKHLKKHLYMRLIPVFLKKQQPDLQIMNSSKVI